MPRTDVGLIVPRMDEDFCGRCNGNDGWTNGELGLFKKKSTFSHLIVTHYNTLLSNQHFICDRYMGSVTDWVTKESPLTLPVCHYNYKVKTFK